MAMYEGKWRCTFCDAVCRGRDMNCTGCGARRGADVEFFLDDDAAPVTDEALLREANDGPDWVCETCGGSNRFSFKTCQTCAAPRGNSTFRKVSETSPNMTAPASDGELPANYRPAAGAWRKTSLKPSYTLLLIMAAGVICLLSMSLSLNSGNVGHSPRSFAPTPDPRHAVRRAVELAVERVEWKRSVVVEEYREVVSEDWEGSVPSDARAISRRQDVHHHERVKVGSHVEQEHYTERVRAGSRTVTETYTDREYSGTESYACGTRNRGNGFFETVYCTRPTYRTVTKTRSKLVDDYQTVPRVRSKTVDDYKDVPVYRTKIKYSAWRWIPADTLTAEGTDLAPRWPEVAAGRSKRAGQRTESYRVFLHDPQSNKIHVREFGAGEFALFSVGSKCSATVNGFEQIVELTPPAANASSLSQTPTPPPSKR